MKHICLCGLILFALISCNLQDILPQQVKNNQLNNVLSDSKGQYGSTYNLNSNNCTDFGLPTIRLAGVKMPSAHGSWGFGSGDNPGQLGQNIRNMPTPMGGLKNTTGETGVSNTGGF
jgi:hypothetical protein